MRRHDATRAHLDAGYLSRIENGKLPPSPGLPLALDQALDTGDTLVALLAGEPAPPWRLNDDLWRPEDSERLADAATRALRLSRDAGSARAVERVSEVRIAATPSRTSSAATANGGRLPGLAW